LLRQRIEKIPAIERTVVSLYFYEEMTLAEIARVLGLHESRIFQLKSQAISRLRGHLLSDWPSEKPCCRPMSSTQALAQQ
jgi:RNA polymerase sigma factor FliA